MMERRDRGRRFRFLKKFAKTSALQHGAEVGDQEEERGAEEVADPEEGAGRRRVGLYRLDRGLQVLKRVQDARQQD